MFGLDQFNRARSNNNALRNVLTSLHERNIIDMTVVETHRPDSVPPMWATTEETTGGTPEGEGAGGAFRQLLGLKGEQQLLVVRCIGNNN